MAGAKRILLAKMGLDCHDTGIVTVAQMLREAGYEVMYMGLHNMADEVVHAAIDEDADMIGVSFLSGQHEAQMKKLLEAMKQANLDIPVVCGGVIPPDDAEELKKMGVAEVLFPGALTAEVLSRVDQVLQKAA